MQGETEQDRLSERAHQDREIVYFLQPPETHAFILYHDYTESRAGVNGYANVVREGSVASHPSASVLDTGEQLKAREMSGAELTASKINAGEDVAPTARVVVIPFATVQAGQTLAAAHRGDLHGAGELPARGRRAGLRPQPRPAAQRGGVAFGLVLHLQRSAGHGDVSCRMDACGSTTGTIGRRPWMCCSRPGGASSRSANGNCARPMA